MKESDVRIDAVTCRHPDSLFAFVVRATRFRQTCTMSRQRYILLALATITVGLAVHRGGTAFAPAFRDFAGDSLWAMMMAWWVGALVPAAPRFARSSIAYAMCVGVELSQLIHTPVLSAIRATALGHLVLGSGFDPRDLLAYLVGVSLAAVLERYIR